MITENLSTLKIHKLTQAQYDRELAADNIDESALYLTPMDVIVSPAVAEIGQTIVVKSVDETGKPTEWEATSLANNLLFDKETGMLYLMGGGQIIGKGVFLETVEGSGNNAVLTLESTTDWSNKTMPINSVCVISFNWSSVEGDVNTGQGTVIVKVNGALQHSGTINQGECSLNIRNYLSLGHNLVHVSVFDFYGNSQMLSFAVNVYDPDNLKSTKLVERTLSGDYINDRVTTVGEGAFSGLTLNRLVLPNVLNTSKASLTSVTASEFELSSLKSLSYWTFSGSSVDVVRLPSLTSIGSEALRCKRIGRMIMNSIETINVSSYSNGGGADIYDFHKLKTLNKLPILAYGSSGNQIIIRTPEVCSLQTSPNTDGKKKVYVPASLIDAYKSATNWSVMADSIFAIEDYPEICEVS